MKQLWQRSNLTQPKFSEQALFDNYNLLNWIIQLGDKQLRQHPDVYIYNSKYQLETDYQAVVTDIKVELANIRHPAITRLVYTHNCP